MKDQDGSGIWTSPSGPGVAAVHAGARVAWFKDPDGNVLSVVQMPSPERSAACDGPEGLLCYRKGQTRLAPPRA